MKLSQTPEQTAVTSIFRGVGGQIHTLAYYEHLWSYINPLYPNIYNSVFFFSNLINRMVTFIFIIHFKGRRRIDGMRGRGTPCPWDSSEKVWTWVSWVQKKKLCLSFAKKCIKILNTDIFFLTLLLDHHPPSTNSAIQRSTW